MKTSFPTLLAVLLASLLPLAGRAQVASGSNGSDGAFNPTANVVIDMADHPDGIYQYTSVNIPAGVTVSFLPNANNKPVVWLVQGSCVISGSVDISGATNTGPIGGREGPGGYRGGDGGSYPTRGSGPGGGSAGGYFGGNASYATVGARLDVTVPESAVYGSAFLFPLVGGSGGGGSTSSSGGQFYGGGGGGGGAILIASSGNLTLTGQINASGLYGSLYPGGGSGGAVRIVAPKIIGSGGINAGSGYGGGLSYNAGGYTVLYYAGVGRVRFDVQENNFGGSISGAFTQGFQPIIIPAIGQGIQLSIASVGGVAVPVSPSGVLVNPDVIITAQQVNPIPVVVNCTNIPLNSEITVKVQPANGAAVTAVGLNNAGTLAASTATVAVNMPRGGGIIYATAVTGLAGGGASIGTPADAKTRTLAETGWTADGERFVQMEITAALGGPQRVAYITASGKRYPAN